MPLFKNKIILLYIEMIATGDIMKIFIQSIIMIVIIIVIMASCTYSITMVHTEGTATDVVDETATNAPSTSLEVPLKI